VAVTADARTTNGRRQLIDAAIASIREVGFYRSSTNEIARRANVTWGSLQYHFGTREKLMLAVLEELDRRFVSHIEAATIEGDTAEARIESLYEVIGRRYEDPEWLVRFQILLDLQYDPDTSAEAMAEVARNAKAAEASIRRLLRETIGPRAPRGEYTALLHAIRGFALSQQVSRAIPIPGTGRAVRDDEVRRFLHRLAIAEDADL
jgi:AcrR family transcriptional regulator